MVVQHNLTAMNANRYLGINNNKLSKSLEKLSSGYAINRAGDNAAGLAVSEKMRSQIAGMTQGVKNAQDGISMVQTFEGALTETHSILQRMKTLADQMANGSYDDPIDRTAAQQEFLQLNDELDQIADTDFNGVIVLNGGKMADGLEAVDGLFDYANKAEQVKAANDKALADAQAAAQKKIDNAQAAFDSAKAAFDAVTKRDLSNNGDALQWNTVDDSYYTADVAKALFEGVTVGADTLADKGISSFDVTFKATAGTNGASPTWEIDKATYIDNDGETQDITDGVKAYLDTVTAVNAGGNKGYGGFTVAAGTDVLANAIFDATNVQDGDTVTLTFTNDAVASKAPTNIGFDDDTVTMDATLNVDRPTIALNTDVVKDSKMSEELKTALDNLDKANVTFEYKTGKLEGKIDGEGLNITRNAEDSTVDDDVWDITYTNSSGNEVVLATVTLESSKEASKASAAVVSAANGNVVKGTTKSAYTGTAWDTALDANTGGELTLKFDGTKWVDSKGNDVATAASELGDTAANAEWKNVTLDDAALAKFVKGTPTKGDEITLTLGVGTKAGDLGVDISKGADATALDTLDERYAYVKAAYTPAEETLGKLSFGIAVSTSEFDSVTKGPDIAPGANPDIDSSTVSAIDKRYYDTKAALAAAKAEYPKTLDDLGDDYKVSVSDAFNKSEAKLTYKDNITLQVGARTKDAVNFTFQYASTSIGDLTADLNCTAKGLGTDKLNLNTQEAANYAIDKIDQAINKVSLIRGTFGAIQNRLEHKIDNMNVSIENLTSAESQIRDTNMPQEMMNFTKNQILAQASQSMLAQANQLPQSVLSLLQ